MFSKMPKTWVLTLSYWVFSLSFEFFSPWVFFKMSNLQAWFNCTCFYLDCSQLAFSLKPAKRTNTCIRALAKFTFIWHFLVYIHAYLSFMVSDVSPVVAWLDTPFMHHDGMKAVLEALQFRLGVHATDLGLNLSDSRLQSCNSPGMDNKTHLVEIFEGLYYFRCSKIHPMPMPL